MEYGLQEETFRSALTDGEKTSYISSTLCLMDAAQAPAKTGYAGSTTVWEELQAAHVSQAQFIHSVVSLLYLIPYGQVGKSMTDMHLVSRGLSCRGTVGT